MSLNTGDVAEGLWVQQRIGIWVIWVHILCKDVTVKRVTLQLRSLQPGLLVLHISPPIATRVRDQCLQTEDVPPTC